MKQSMMNIPVLDNLCLLIASTTNILLTSVKFNIENQEQLTILYDTLPIYLHLFTHLYVQGNLSDCVILRSLL